MIRDDDKINKTMVIKGKRRASLYSSRGFRAVADPMKYVSVRWSSIEPPGITKPAKRGWDRIVRRHSSFGRIVDGDWDLECEMAGDWPGGFPVQEAVLEAIRMRIEEGKQWEKTGIYDFRMKQIKKTGKSNGRTNLSEVMEKYERIDKVIQYAKKNGKLKNNDELRKEPFCHQILINIGRGGRIFFLSFGGNHRIAIAKVMNIPIQARVLCRHKQWQEVRERMFSSLASGKENAIIAGGGEGGHPDLEDITGQGGVEAK